MASTISAGTTTSTGLVCTADTTGALVLQTNNGTTAVTIDTSQNVGIGTTSPSTYGKLAVVSSTAGAAKISIQDTSAGAAAPLLQFGLNDTGGFNTSDAARIWTIAATTSVASLNFSAYNGGAPSTAQMVLTGGKMGIGTTSPGANLEVKGASGQNIYVSYTSGSQLRLKSDSGDSGVGTTGSTPLLFLINNGEVARFNSSGNILCLSGGSTSASGTGIAFPATQSASADANTLDDYEEGTFTPNLVNNGSSSTFTVKNGYYRKIGSLVICWVDFDSGNSGTAGTTLQVTGLPFTMVTGPRAAMNGGFWGANGLATNNGGFDPQGGTTTVNIYIGGGIVTSQTTYLSGTIIYMASA